MRVFLLVFPFLSFPSFLFVFLFFLSRLSWGGGIGYLPWDPPCFAWGMVVAFGCWWRQGLCSSAALWFTTDDAAASPDSVGPGDACNGLLLPWCGRGAPLHEPAHLTRKGDGPARLV